MFNQCPLAERACFASHHNFTATRLFRLTVAFLILQPCCLLNAATITGTVKNNDNNPVAGVTIKATNGNTATTVTSPPGTYSLAVPDGWSGYIVATQVQVPPGVSLPNTPAYRLINNASGTIAGQDFTMRVPANPAPVTLSGTVTVSGGGGLPYVLVYANANGGGDITDASGNFAIGILPSGPPLTWSGTITPLRDGYTFNPAAKTYTSQSIPPGGSISGCNFTGTASGGGDTQPPSWPQGSALNATSITSSGAQLSWTAAQDNVGVAGYRLFRGAETSVYATVTGATNTSVSGLSPQTAYTFTVQAYDAADNATTNGPAVQFTTSNAVPARGKILFTRKVTTTDWDLWTMNRDGTEQAVLLDTAYEDRMPRYSNDGSLIVFTRNTAGTGDILTADAEGGSVSNLTADLPNSAFSGRYSWDNRQICFDYYVGVTNHDIYVMNADGTGKRAVATLRRRIADRARHRALGQQRDGTVRVWRKCGGNGVRGQEQRRRHARLYGRQQCRLARGQPVFRLVRL